MSTKELTLQAVADLVGGTVHGDASVVIRAVAATQSAGAGDLTFAVDAKHASNLTDSAASAAIVSDVPQDAPMPVVAVENVQAALARVLGHFAPPADAPPVGIDATARIADSAEISPRAAVGPYVTVGPGSTVAAGCVLADKVTVGRNVAIGARTRLQAGTVIHHDTQIGADVLIGANGVIGQTGFGYFTVEGRHELIPHAGNVVIEDDVHLGACVCIDRAKFGSTRIGTGSRVDNLVQIAHNVQIGRGCILCGQVGLAGSCRLGDYVVLGGSVGVRDNVTVGSGVQSAAFAAIAQDLEDGQIVSGIPAHNAREHLREIQAQRKLPELLKQVRELEARLAKLESPENA